MGAGQPGVAAIVQPSRLYCYRTGVIRRRHRLRPLKSSTAPRSGSMTRSALNFLPVFERNPVNRIRSSLSRDRTLASVRLRPAMIGQSIQPHPAVRVHVPASSRDCRLVEHCQVFPRLMTGLPHLGHPPYSSVACKWLAISGLPRKMSCA